MTGLGPLGFRVSGLGLSVPEPCKVNVPTIQADARFCSLGKPLTLHPQLYALNPKLYTLNPKP